MSSIVRTPVWAIVFPDGRIITGTDLDDEEHAWTIAMGWPHASEIEQAKRLGVFATRAVIEFRVSPGSSPGAIAQVRAAGGIEGSPQFQALPEDQQAEFREWLELLKHTTQ